VIKAGNVIICSRKRNKPVFSYALGIVFLQCMVKFAKGAL
jgi:hypothetical protein